MELDFLFLLNPHIHSKLTLLRITNMHLPSTLPIVMIQIDKRSLVELLLLGLSIKVTETGVGGVAIEAKLRVIMLMFITRIIYGILLIFVKLARCDRVLEGLTTHHIHFLFFDGLHPRGTTRQTRQVDLKKWVGNVVLIVDLPDVLHHEFVVFVGLEVRELRGTGFEDLEVMEQHAVDLMLQPIAGRVFRHQYNFNKHFEEIIAIKTGKVSPPTHKSSMIQFDGDNIKSIRIISSWWPTHGMSHWQAPLMIKISASRLRCFCLHHFCCLAIPCMLSSAARF